MKADSKFNSVLISRLVNVVMRQGSKGTAEKIVYGMCDRLSEMHKDTNAVDVVKRAVDNVKPRLEVKSRRVGGATYQVPLEVSGDRQAALAIRWIVRFAKARRSKSMVDALTAEVKEAFQGQGSAIRKRDEVHKMAQSNKAFAHFRW